MQRLCITENTEEILRRRCDDYRIAFIVDTLFCDDFGGVYKDRTLNFGSPNGERKSVKIEKASVYDTFEYEKVQGDGAMARTIEENLININRMKKNAAGQSGMGIGLPKYVVLFVWTCADDGTDISLNAYYDPSAEDVGDILRSKRQIIMSCFISAYSMKQQGVQYPAGFPDEGRVWTFLSPLDVDKLEEYKNIAKEIEARQLNSVFLIDFLK